MKKALPYLVVVSLSVLGMAVFYGAYLPRLEKERMARQLAFNESAGPYLSEFARVADQAVSLAFKTNTFRERENAFRNVLISTASLRQSLQGLDPPNDEMTQFVRYLLELDQALSEVAEMELRLVRLELENRAFENAIAKYEAHIQYFTQVDYADANRFNELSRRVDRARKILLGKKRITKELSNQEIKETVLKFYRDAFNFLHAYRGMIRPDAKNLWSKVNAARAKEQVV